ncbi:unnamed protein product [Rhizoctonia solani]|uniref:DUF3835 domain-containing protein n=3 Tax=Rhizoctonia solani TaxID=456999 RepID=A0A8H3DN34_9AGAM|nr:DUF3835 domain protein [Rhizoctonia solani AG-3 Rhs1AP]KEP51690.1 DUF3835 domain protein [Rhizoctonia solani 123E]CAE6436295.1 unnamed protein product [Rhizoctonia solani]CAE6533116.1 unnamed protein product [Rhizoctonia solani]
MSTTAQGGETRSIGASKQEALRALLNSLVPNGQMAFPDDANVDKLAEKLDELLASKGGIDAYTNIPRDDQGRPLNEEGLPIMEIIEPVANTNESSVAQPSSMDITSSSMSMLGQAPLSPLPNWALSLAALAARRRERDRILDMLEREEEAEYARAAAATHEPTNRNSEAVSQPVPATPLHALDQAFRSPDPNSSFPSGPSASSSNEESPRPSGDFVAPASQGDLATRKPKKQKSVSFVDPPSNYQDGRSYSPKPELDWGDVIPVRLDSRKPGLTKGHGVMKDLVVERPRSQSSAVANRVVDSDDEDEDEEPNEVHDVPEDEDSETEVPKEALGQLETSDDESDVDREETAQGVDVDDTDFDEAMLQREIALAYYARRNQMGADISSGPLSNSTSMDWVAGRDGRDEPARGVMETNSTRFRGSRLPGDPQALVNSAVQFGRLVDGELVVNETADKAVESSIGTLTGCTSGQEDMTENMIELLRRGDTHAGHDPTIIEPNPSIKKIPREIPTPGSRLSVSESIPPRSMASTHRSKPHSSPAPSLASPTSSQRQAIPPPPTNDRPMIIESGFGFDPAFQVAPPPKPSVAKTPAPMSEIVQERVATPSPAPTGTLEKKRSRFAQARAPGQFPASQQITSSLTSARVQPTIGSDVVERTPNPPSVVKNSEPPKRMSRFRAERSGWM